VSLCTSDKFEASTCYSYSCKSNDSAYSGCYSQTCQARNQDGRKEEEKTTLVNEKSLETLSAAYHLALVTVLPALFIGLSLFLLCTKLWFISAGYWIYVYVDKKVLETSRRGGRRFECVRSSALTRLYCQYFPISVTKTADLNPKQNYIISYHPHGIMATGVLGGFGTTHSGFETKYPGIKASILTLNINLLWPFTRDYGLALGCCDVDKESIDWLLTKQGRGNAIVIVPGGAEEALEARPGSHTIILRKRKGFVKMAIKYGAPLVPAYAFGETDLWNQFPNPPGSFVRTVQSFLKGILTFSPPLFYGRGPFNIRFGPLPYRKPINIVIGSPLPLVSHFDPSQDQIDDLHALYVDSICKLFEQHKTKYGISEDTQLTVL